MDWNTDKLFATANRKDLIGQTITSVNPGEGGNIVLMGHNYDNGYYAWEDAFVNIKSLTPGDQIIAYTEGGGEYHYTVQLVKKVPWREENAAEAAKHFKYLGPTAWRAIDPGHLRRRERLALAGAPVRGGSAGPVKPAQKYSLPEGGWRCFRVISGWTLCYNRVHKPR